MENSRKKDPIHFMDRILFNSGLYSGVLISVADRVAGVAAGHGSSGLGCRFSDRLAPGTPNGTAQELGLIGRRLDQALAPARGRERLRYGNR
jgi:hypothetical protein